MQIIAALLALPLALAAVVPVTVPTVNGTCSLDISPLALDTTSVDVISTLRDLVQSGAITIDSTSLTKRANVPGLSCDYLGATRCALNTDDSVVSSCFWSAISQIDISNNAKCLNAAAALGSALPADCRTCLGW